MLCPLNDKLRLERVDTPGAKKKIKLEEIK